MTCREAIEFLMSYLDDELSPEVRAEFERHLSVCSSCVAYLESYRQTIALSKSGVAEAEAGDAQELPPELLAGIQNALRPK
jgi:anti-sigma factor RsiW